MTKPSLKDINTLLEILHNTAHSSHANYKECIKSNVSHIEIIQVVTQNFQQIEHILSLIDEKLKPKMKSNKLVKPRNEYIENIN